jgi:hypothetical protein
MAKSVHSAGDFLIDPSFPYPILKGFQGSFVKTPTYNMEVYKPKPPRVKVPSHPPTIEVKSDVQEGPVWDPYLELAAQLQKVQDQIAVLANSKTCPTHFCDHSHACDDVWWCLNKLIGERTMLARLVTRVKFGSEPESYADSRHAEKARLPLVGKITKRSRAWRLAHGKFNPLDVRATAAEELQRNTRRQFLVSLSEKQPPLVDGVATLTYTVPSKRLLVTVKSLVAPAPFSVIAESTVIEEKPWLPKRTGFYSHCTHPLPHYSVIDAQSLRTLDDSTIKLVSPSQFYASWRYSPEKFYELRNYPVKTPD